MTQAPLKPLQVGLLGMGTVGCGTWTVLKRNEEEISRRAGRPIRITWIALGIGESNRTLPCDSFIHDLEQQSVQALFEVNSFYLVHVWDHCP